MQKFLSLSISYSDFARKQLETLNNHLSEGWRIKKKSVQGDKAVFLMEISNEIPEKQKMILIDFRGIVDDSDRHERFKKLNDYLSDGWKVVNIQAANAKKDSVCYVLIEKKG